MKVGKYAKPSNRKIRKYDRGGDMDRAGASSINRTTPYGTEEQNQGTGYSTKPNYAQAGIGLATEAGAMAGNYLENNAYKSDGKVNVGQYATGEALNWGAKGATAGMAFGPWGAAIGAGAGLIGGSIYGAVHGNQMNHEAQLHQQLIKENQDKMNQQIAGAKTEAQKQYSKGYYSANPTYGHQGASIYRGGGKLIYPDGGLTPQQWNEKNTKLGYLPTPGATSATGGYNPYYDPKMFSVTPDKNYTSGYKWGSLNPAATVDAFNTPAGSGYYNYTRPTTSFAVKPSKPFVQAQQTNMVQNSFGRMGAGTYARTEGGQNVWYDKTGNVLGQPVLGTTGALATEVKAYGGYTYAPGGVLKHLASDTVQAEGNTHAQGGIDLVSNNGNPYAEVENKEVIKGDEVFSNRLKTNGKTYAKVAAGLSKQKGNFEKKLGSTSGTTKATAKRMVANLSDKLEDLFHQQEESKAKKGAVGQNKVLADGGYSKVDWNSAINSTVPFIDNLYNANMISRIPNVPIPTTKVGLNEQAGAMKTTYNINPALNEVNKDYQAFNTGTTQNTLSSNDIRANKLAAYSSLLGNKSNLYGQKENIETQLKNQDVLNRQDVSNRNIRNAQDIANTNLSQTDKYNLARTDRTNMILQAKSANVANATADAMRLIQDKGMKGVDEGRIMTDALKYNDAAGFAKLVGSSTMDSLIRSDSKHYSTIEKALKEAGQTSALGDFYKRYGKR